MVHKTIIINACLHHSRFSRSDRVNMSDIQKFLCDNMHWSDLCKFVISTAAFKRYRFMLKMTAQSDRIFRFFPFRV